MAQEIPVLIDPSLGVTPAELKAAWDVDPDAQRVGRIEERPSGQQFAGLLELVVIPVAVKVAADVITDVIKKLLAGKVKEPVDVGQQKLPNGQDAVVVQKK